MVLGQYLIFFCDVLLCKSLLELISSLLQLLNKLIEALINIPGLLFVKPLNLLLDVLDELPIIIVDPLGVQHQLVQIVDVLLDDVGHVFQLSQLVAIVVREHAFVTHDRVAKFTEVFDLLVLMLEAVHFAASCLRD